MKEGINFYIEESSKAINFFKGHQDDNLSDLHFQIALAEVLGIDENNSHLVFERRLNSDEMIQLLYNYKWPELVCTVCLNKSIIPESLISRIDEEKIKHNNEVWYIYKNDADPLPSNPHAHNLKNGLKLHLGNGGLYRKNKFTGKEISKKDLKNIREKIQHNSLENLPFQR
jgi:hypothetical protein